MTLKKEDIMLRWGERCGGNMLKMMGFLAHCKKAEGMGVIFVGMSDKKKIASPIDMKVWKRTDKPAGEVAAKPPNDKAAPHTSVFKEQELGVRSEKIEKQELSTAEKNKDRKEEQISGKEQKKDVPKLELGNEGGVVNAGKKKPHIANTPERPRKPNTELNARQRKFGEEYMNSGEPGNATLAAQKAGYSEKSAYSHGSRLLKNAKVQEYIKFLQEKAADAVIRTRAAVIKDVLLVKDRCMQEVRPLLDKKGEHLMVEDADGSMKLAYVFDSGGSLKALELEAKLAGHLNLGKLEVSLTKPVRFEGEEELD